MGRWSSPVGALMLVGIVLVLAARSSGPPRQRVAPAPGPLTSASHDPDLRPWELIDTLDDSLQQRFAEVDGPIFGMRRIPVTPEHGEIAYLQPETAAEKEAVRGLRAAGWDAGFLVASPARMKALERFARRGRYGEGDFDRWIAQDGRHYAVSMPIVLAGARQTEAYPGQPELLPHVRAALAAFQAAGSHTFRRGPWSVVARPIRASKPACIGCHAQRDGDPPLRLGDPVGVALYAFARREGSGAPAGD